MRREDCRSLADGQGSYTLTAEKGITVAEGNTLNIYVGKKILQNGEGAITIIGNGVLIAGLHENTFDSCAGIGGWNGDGGTVNWSL